MPIEKVMALHNVIILIKLVCILCCEKTYKILDVNVDNIVISKLVKTKTNSKYLIGYLGKVIRPLVLIMPKMSGYVRDI